MEKKRELIGEYNYYLVFLIWFGTEIIFNTNIKSIFGYSLSDLNEIMAIIILVMLMFHIVIVQEYLHREILVLAPISLAIVYATVNSNHKALISMWLFVIAAKYVNLDNIARIAYVLLICMIIYVFIMFYFDKIDEITLFRNSIIRHSLGFSHPNQLGLRIFQLALCRLFIRRNRIDFFDYLITIALGIFVYRVPNSQASFYSIIILLFFILVYQLSWDKDRMKEIISRILIFISVLSNIVSVFFSTLNIRKIPVLRVIDKFLSYRFSQCYRTYRYYGVSMFGNDIKSIISKPVIGKYYHFWLDNAYMAILIRYGVLVYILFSFIYCFTMIKLKKQGQYFLLFVYTLFSIYGIMEYNFFALSHNIFLIAISSMIYNTQVTKKINPRIKYRFRMVS